MSIVDGLRVNAANSNAAWVSKTTDDSQSGKLTITNTTESTSETTGALVVSGGVGVGGNVTIGGDLVVKGTTTSLETINTQINDNNIEINVGGNDASSENAGITINRSTTDAGFFYEDALASKFKIGLIGSLYEIIVSGVAQSISGAKTFLNNISLNSNKITDLAPGAALTDAVNKNQMDGEGGISYIATTGGTTNLSDTDSQTNITYGSLTHTLVLPDPSTMTIGKKYETTNRSSGAVTVKDHAGNTLYVLEQNQRGQSKVRNLSSFPYWGKSVYALFDEDNTALYAGAKLISNVSDPVSAQDAATKNWSETQISAAESSAISTATANAGAYTDAEVLAVQQQIDSDFGFQSISLDGGSYDMTGKKVLANGATGTTILKLPSATTLENGYRLELYITGTSLTGGGGIYKNDGTTLFSTAPANYRVSLIVTDSSTDTWTGYYSPLKTSTINAANVKIINLGSGTSSTDAINKGQLDTHEGLTATHGTTGDIVGTTDSQTLTNKTLTEPVSDILTVDGQSGTPTSPPTGYFKTYIKDDGKMYVLDSLGTESVIGTGTGIGSVNYTTERFSGTGSQTNFTLALDPLNENNVFVFISGVYQQKDTFSVSGTTLTFSSAPPAGTDNIEVNYTEPLTIGIPGNNTVSNGKMTTMPDLTFKGNISGTTAIPSDVTVSDMKSIFFDSDYLFETGIRNIQTGGYMPSATDYYAAVYANGYFVIVGSYSTTARVLSSNNLRSWTTTNNPANLVLEVSQLRYINSKIFALSWYSSTTSYSTDNGATWTQSAGYGGSQTEWTGIAYGAGVYVASLLSGGGSSYGLFYSSDLSSWTATGGTSEYYLDVCFDGTKFIAIKQNSTSVFTSTNGSSWTEHTSAFPDTMTYSKVKYINGIYLATNENKIYKSTDGTSWSVVFTDIASSQVFWTIDYDATTGYYLCLDITLNGRVAYSKDGINWKAVEVFSFSSYSQAVAFGNGKLILPTQRNMSFATALNLT